MLTFRITITTVLLSVLSIIVFSGYKPAEKVSRYQAKELEIIVSLDEVQPGAITVKQVLALKQLNVKVANGGAQVARSFNILVMPKSGPSHFAKCVGNKFQSGAMDILRNCRPGDLILVSSIVLFGNAKYKTIVDPKWTVVADPK